MNQYKILQNPGGVIKVVKQGWNWMAFFTNAFWALNEGMKKLGIGFFLLLILLGTLNFIFGAKDNNPSTDPEVISAHVISLVINLFMIIVWIPFGAFGNSWLERSWLAKGYEFMELISAENKDQAIEMYVKHKLLIS